jgi:hypothetical protein
LGRKKNGMGIGKGSLAKWKTKKSPTSFLRREYIGKEEKKTFKKKHLDGICSTPSTIINCEGIQKGCK